MAQLNKLPLRILVAGALVLALQACRSDAASNAVELACSGGMIQGTQAAMLVDASDDLRSGDAQLDVPSDCATTLGNGVPNPYLLALQAAASMATPDSLGEGIAAAYGRTFAADPIIRAATDRTIAYYLRLGCGVELPCIEATLKAMPDFRPEASPVFCDLVGTPTAPTVLSALKSGDLGVLDLQCSGHTGETGSTAFETRRATWLEAFDELEDLR
ncbi:hypothetical protein [Vannielia sp.]|uniref:hypothetical protein n=1 Tax=Vannielia sp. TaxID=2813045 RepID=UPI00262166BD|nr:hypothetical protein [Vannielia sp.]MDF1873675.1 hypothetical protein [Vannielia sp.]